MCFAYRAVANGTQTAYKCKHSSQDNIEAKAFGYGCLAMSAARNDVFSRLRVVLRR